MSRSYRKPYCAVCGGDSAHEDKKLAARGVRRKQNLYTRLAKDYDTFLLPDRLECSHNETYGWARDGGQTLQFPYSQNLLDKGFDNEWWIKLHRK